MEVKMEIETKSEEEKREVKKEVKEKPKPEATAKAEEKLDSGDIALYTKDVVRIVVDEEGARIPVESDFEAKCLSLIVRMYKEVMKK